MAKLLPPFILCPLADRKEFLGISPDQQENKAILTIGKNIAIKYHVLEQKQEVSWISSRHWFTSRVVYCADLGKYGAVIDYTTVILFDESDSNLASMKKYKFAKPVAELKPTKSLGTLVVFKNGAVKNLSHVISIKKGTLELELKDKLNVAEEVLLSTAIDEKRNQAVLLIGFTNEVQTTAKCGMDKVKRIKVIVLDLNRINSQDARVKFSTTIQRDGNDILGCTVTNFSEIGGTVVYLCSDGYLYQELLSPPVKDESADTDSSAAPSETGSKIAFVEKYVSNSNGVIIEALDSSTVVIYGCDPSEEGACVLIYDISYNILITKQSLKLYSAPPMMEKVGSHIFVPVGLHVLVLGLKLTQSRLSAVVGKHQIQEVDLFEKREPFVHPWHSLTQDYETNRSTNGELIQAALDEDNDMEVSFSTENFENVYKLVKTLERDGQPESMICGQIIPHIIEERNIDALKWAVEYFSDIPESSLLYVLIFLMTSAEDGSIATDLNISPPDDTRTLFPNTLLINQILNRDFDQKQLVHQFRRLGFDTVKLFLQYFWQRMNDLWGIRVVLETDAEVEGIQRYHELLQVFKWASVLFDAHYPQFVSKNETDLVDKIFQFINDKVKEMDQVESLEPLITLIMSKISYEPKPAPNAKYRVETITFE